MPLSTEPLAKLGFLTIGIFDGDDPGAGHETTLRIIELGEQLGFDSAWVRHRPLQYGISSPVAVLAAATQRTSRIALGTAVIPLGWENPLRLAEDLATVDILSGGRLNPGLSVGPPMHHDEVRHALSPDTADVEDFTYQRMTRLMSLIRGEPATDFRGVEGHGGLLRPGAAAFGRAGRTDVVGRRQPAVGRMGRQHRDEPPDQQRGQGRAGGRLRTDPALPHPLVPRPPPGGGPGPGVAGSGRDPDRLRVRGPAGEVRGVRPEAASPHCKSAGSGGMLFAADLVGPSAQIADRLHRHAAFREIDEVAFALPFSFAHDDYVQILTDIATELGPALGWSPAG